MRTNLNLFFVFLFIFFVPHATSAKCRLDFLDFKELEGTAELSDLGKIRIGTYNVLNLQYSGGKYVRNPETGAREFQSLKITKDPKATSAIAEIIKSENLDIVILQEVEGRNAVDLFNKNFLNSKYEIFITSGNDSRGIEIAFLVKKELPFKIKLASNKDTTWINPNSSNEELIFTRDLPALHVWGKHTSGTDPPDFIILGNHLKSQRDRKGDPMSVKLRTRQMEEVERIIKEYEEEFPNIPVFLGGDFNANIHEGREFKNIFKNGLMQDSFDLLPKKLAPQERITHTFHPRGGETKYSQLDAIMANKHGAKLITDAKVYRYKDEFGFEKRIPSTYDEREMNPSDHFPVIVVLDLTKLKKK